MSVAQLWGWDLANKVWIPLQVDANGYVKVDLSNINLDDLGDVSVAAPGDGEILYWNDAAGEWQARAEDIFVCADLNACVLNALGDVNVPAPADREGICWDAASSKWICGKSARILTTQGDMLIHGAADLERLPKGKNRYFLCMGASEPEWVKGFEFAPDPRQWQHELEFFDWTTATLGSGAVEAQGYGVLRLKSGRTAGGKARGRGFLWGWQEFHDLDIDWFAWLINFRTSANGKKWLKMDEDIFDDPVSQSIGWRLDGTALKGITHDGTNLHVVDLSLAVPDGAHIRLFMRFLHLNKVQWYVDGDLKGESTDIPTTQAPHDVWPIFAVSNGIDSAHNSMQINTHDWIKDT